MSDACEMVAGRVHFKALRPEAPFGFERFGSVMVRDWVCRHYWSADVRSHSSVHPVQRVQDLVDVADRVDAGPLCLPKAI